MNRLRRIYNALFSPGTNQLYDHFSRLAKFDDPEYMSTLLFEKAVTDKYSSEDFRMFKLIMEKLNIPMPEPGEFFVGAESIHVASKARGVVFRVGHPMCTSEHDLLLKPWKAVNLNHAVFEILPILPSYPKKHYRDDDFPVEAKDMLMTCSLLQDEGCNAYDGYDGFFGILGAHNFGALPVSVEPFKSGTLPLIRDRGAVKDYTEELITELDIKINFNEAAAYRGVQEKYYAKFLSLVERAWPDGEPLPTNPDAVNNLWKACIEDIKNFKAGKPSTLLLDQRSDNSMFDNAANRYDARTCALA